MPKWGYNKDGKVVEELTLTNNYADSVLFARLENSDQFNLLVEFVSGAADVDIQVAFGWNEDTAGSDFLLKKFFTETLDDGSGNLSAREFSISAAVAGTEEGKLRLTLPVAVAENAARVRLRGNGDVVKVAFTTSNPKNPFQR